MRSALSITDALLSRLPPVLLMCGHLKISTLIEEIKAIRGDFPIYAILNNADSTGSDNAEAIEALVDYPQLKYLDVPIRRKSIATSAGRGMSVLEFTPKDSKACDEIQNLVNIIYLS